MDKPKVRLLGDPVLKHRTIEVERTHWDFMPGMVSTMIEVMKDEKGIGLAANQIGSSYRMFVLGIEGNNEDYINPEILEQSDLVDFEEGCLSIPGAMGKTKRFNKLTLRWSNLSSGYEVRHEASFEGLKAFAIQHEMDHLDGKLYIDQFGPLKRTMTIDKHKKFLKRLSRS